MAISNIYSKYKCSFFNYQYSRIRALSPTHEKVDAYNPEMLKLKRIELVETDAKDFSYSTKTKKESMIEKPKDAQIKKN